MYVYMCLDGCDSLGLLFTGWPRIPSIVIGAPFGSVVSTVDELNALLHPHAKGKFILNIRSSDIYVVLHVGASDQDMIRCCYQAATVRAVLCGVKRTMSDKTNVKEVA